MAGRSDSGAAQGGTLRVDSAEELDSTDPAIADSYVDWALLYASCAKLLNYPDSQVPRAHDWFLRSPRRFRPISRAD